MAISNEELFPNPNGGANSPSDKPKQKRPRMKAKQKSAKALTVSDTAVQIVWEHWLTTMGSTRAVRDHERSVTIAAAIHDYGIEQCKQAIDGCATSPWHMGDNPQQKKYNSIDLIFRDADKTEGFIQRATFRDAKQEFINTPRRKAGQQ